MMFYGPYRIKLLAREIFRVKDRGKFLDGVSMQKWVYELEVSFVQ